MGAYTDPKEYSIDYGKVSKDIDSGMARVGKAVGDLNQKRADAVEKIENEHALFLDKTAIQNFEGLNDDMNNSIKESIGSAVSVEDFSRMSQMQKQNVLQDVAEVKLGKENVSSVIKAVRENVLDGRISSEYGDFASDLANGRNVSIRKSEDGIGFVFDHTVAGKTETFDLTDLKAMAGTFRDVSEDLAVVDGSIDNAAKELQKSMQVAYDNGEELSDVDQRQMIDELLSTVPIETLDIWYSKNVEKGGSMLESYSFADDAQNKNIREKQKEALSQAMFDKVKAKVRVKEKIVDNSKIQEIREKGRQDRLTQDNKNKDTDDSVSEIPKSILEKESEASVAGDGVSSRRSMQKGVSVFRDNSRSSHQEILIKDKGKTITSGKIIAVSKNTEGEIVFIVDAKDKKGNQNTEVSPEKAAKYLKPEQLAHLIKMGEDIKVTSDVDLFIEAMSENTGVSDIKISELKEYLPNALNISDPSYSWNDLRFTLNGVEHEFNMDEPADQVKLKELIESEKSDSPKKKKLKSSDVAAKAKASGYTEKEYRKLLIENGIEIIE
tara:strand:- start:21321 stop:22976 length:1656 start_codon:yes stop_codon:yes gene_type:complete